MRTIHLFLCVVLSFAAPASANAADVPGYGIKFTSPIVANGKVYISTGHDLTTATNPRGEIDVYGLK